MARTGLFVRQQTGGMFAVENMDISTGERFYVDSGATSTGADSISKGRNPDAPFVTLAYAFSGDQPTASNGDTIILMPGHAESIAAAAGIVCDLAGVTVIGLGDGDNRPVLTFDTDATADIDITAANVTFENISFKCDIADLAAALHVTGAHFKLKNCSFIGTDAADEAFLIAVLTTATANDIIIEDCQFYSQFAENGTAITTTSTECIRLVGADRAIIKNCYMSGDYTTAAINSVTTASDDIQILDNIIQNIATENIAGGIDLEASTTGFLDGNVLYVDDPTSAEDVIDDGSCAIGRNWVTNAIGTAPILWGVAGSAGVEGKIDVIDGYHDVPTADTTNDAQMRDVIGKKNDAAVVAVVTNKSLMGYIKGLIGFHTVAVEDTTTDAQMRDVIGKKSDTALTAVVTNKGLMGYVKGLIGFHTVAVVDTTTDAQMRDVVGKKSDAALTGAVVTNKSLMGYAKQNVTNTEAISLMHGVAVEDTTTDVHMSDVVGKKSDTALTAVVTNKSIMGYTKGLINFHTVAVEDTTTDAQMRDVIGKKSDTALTAVVTNKGLMGYVKGLIGFHTIPAKDTTDDAQMRDVVGKKEDDAVVTVATTKSIVAMAKGLMGFHTVPAKDTTDDAQMRDVVGKKEDDAAAGAVTTTESLVAYAKQNASANIQSVVALGGQVRKTADFVAGAGTGNIGTFALFTVTGAVKFSIIATCSDTCVGAATLECGVTGTTAGIIAQIADATDLITGEIWADATPTLALDTLANSELSFVIGDGEDIFLTIGAANLTDGTIDFNIVWTPLNATGNVVAA